MKKLMPTLKIIQIKLFNKKKIPTALTVGELNWNKMLKIEKQVSPSYKYLGILHYLIPN